MTHVKQGVENVLSKCLVHSSYTRSVQNTQYYLNIFKALSEYSNIFEFVLCHENEYEYLFEHQNIRIFEYSNICAHPWSSVLKVVWVRWATLSFQIWGPGFWWEYHLAYYAHTPTKTFSFFKIFLMLQAFRKENHIN